MERSAIFTHKFSESLFNLLGLREKQSAVFVRACIREILSLWRHIHVGLQDGAAYAWFYSFLIIRRC